MRVWIVVLQGVLLGAGPEVRPTYGFDGGADDVGPPGGTDGSEADADPLRDATPIAADERVVFFDTAARREPDGDGWIVRIHGWIHEPETSIVRRKILQEVLESAADAEVEGASRKIFDERITPFLADNERGKRVAVHVAGRVHVLAASTANGHFSGEIEIDDRAVREHAKDGRLGFWAEGAAERGGPPRRFEGAVHLTGSRGITVVSDIDDTVKRTGVADRKEMLRRTFLQEFEPVPGMAARYAEWTRRGDVSIHFVSSSPWQLYEPLREFLDASEFPRAPLHLKAVRFRDRTFFDLFKSGTETKPPIIESLLEAWPERRFVLVGDSGEEDPEVYARLFRDHPGRIERIWIRNVTGALPDDERFRVVFDGIDRTRWGLFDDPAEIDLGAETGAGGEAASSK